MTPAAPSPSPWPAVELDHLVVAAGSLAAGIAWCETTLGVVPSAGGRHPLMGTHNVLLNLSSPRFPRSYLEIIAIDPEAPALARRRWYDLDRPELRQTLRDGPRLVHWVVRTDALDRLIEPVRALGYDVGTVTAAERTTPAGTLRWRITIPDDDDGGRPAAGALPLFIEWAGSHPSDSLPECGVALGDVVLNGLAAELAQRLGVVASDDGAPALRARLRTPRGAVELRSA